MSAGLNASSRVLRVLITADAVGGVWQYALDLARGLSDCGVEPVIAVLGPSPASHQLAQAGAVPGLRLVNTGLALEWTAGGPDEVTAAGHALARLAQELAADLVHLNSPALAADAHFRMPVVAACHSCVATWWEAVRSGPLPEDFRWRKQLVTQGYAAADALIAPTRAFAEATARTYALARAPTVVHNGRRGIAAPGAPAPAEPFVFTAGRLWDDGKNLVALDRAAARLGAPVLAAGSQHGPNGAAIAVSHVHALGPLPDGEVAGYLAARPVFASLALYEPFGLAVLEAAQAGCALVLSDIATFRELWEGAAVFVDPHDAAAVAAALKCVLQDSMLRERLGETARAHAARYTPEAMTGGVVSVYRDVLARRSARTPAEAAA